MKTRTYRLAVAATIALSIASFGCRPRSSSEADRHTNSPGYSRSYSQSEVVTPDNPSSPSTNNRPTATSVSGSDTLTRDNSFVPKNPTNDTSSNRSDALTPDNSYNPGTTNQPPATNPPSATSPGTTP